MLRTSSGSGEPQVTTDDRRSVVTGLAAGVIGISCCVGPAVAALIGVTSAAVAIDVATDLYNNWGWAFRGVGLVFAGMVVAVSLKRRRACGAEPRAVRNIAIVAVTGVATYVSLYGATTWLGARASEPPPPPRIAVEGSSLQQRVDSAVAQVRKHYPNFRVEIDGLSFEQVALRVGWVLPDVDPSSDDYSEEIVRRVEDSREATIVLLRAIARSNPDMTRFSAYEDRLVIPIWSRAQILAAGEPDALRAFDDYRRFVFSAEDRGGYSVLFGNR